MWKSRWRGGVFVTFMGFAGLAITLSSAHRSAALWPVWAVLAVSLCIAAGLVAVYALASWRDLSPARRLPWRTAVLPTAVIGIAVLLALVSNELLATRPGGGWRGDVLVFLAFTGGGCAGAVMLGVRSTVVKQSVPPEDMTAFEAAIVELTGLRRRLQRLLAALGSLVALSTLALGAGMLLGNYQPREIVVVFGGAGSALVGIFYAPAATAVRVRGERLVAMILATTKLSDATELVAHLERRAKLEQLIGVDRTLFGDLQSAIPVLGPLIAGAAVFLPR
jgi:hypothetical protein